MTERVGSFGGMMIGETHIQGMSQWQAVVKMIEGISWPATKLSVSQDRLLHGVTLAKSGTLK